MNCILKKTKFVAEQFRVDLNKVPPVIFIHKIPYPIHFTEKSHFPFISVMTTMGVMRVSDGDWILVDEDGDLSVVSNYIFKTKYQGITI